MDKVLLVIPAYNEGKEYRAGGRSAYRKFFGLDYIVVNDGSKDRTAEICRKRGYRLWIFRSIWDWPVVFRPG